LLFIARKARDAFPSSTLVSRCQKLMCPFPAIVVGLQYLPVCDHFSVWGSVFFDVGPTQRFQKRDSFAHVVDFSCNRVVLGFCLHLSAQLRSGCSRTLPTPDWPYPIV